MTQGWTVMLVLTAGFLQGSVANGQDIPLAYRQVAAANDIPADIFYWWHSPKAAASSGLAVQCDPGHGR